MADEAEGSAEWHPGAALAEAVDAVVDRHALRHVALAVAVDAPSGSYASARGTLDGIGAPSTSTLFEIGSVTKVFTATLLLRMTEAGEVGLGEPVQDLLPPGVRLPVVGRPITLLDLATHRSGLPRLPRRWLRRLRRHLDDPYAVLTLDDVWHAVATCRRRRPGGPARYSNLGVGLLGHALEHRAGMSYETLVSQRICTPLGLADTTFGGRAEDAARTAGGHDTKGRPVPHWHFPVLGAAGALHSTTSDLMTFLRAQDDPADTPVHRAIRATHEPVASRLALESCPGWMAIRGKDPGRRLLWHNGGTGGFRSYVAFVPGHRLRVAVLAADARPVDRIGQDIVVALTPA